MSNSAWMSRLLALGGILETAAGLGLLIAPSPLAWILLRSELVGPGVVLARLGGGGLLALGIACWSARLTPSTPAGLGVARAFLTYNLIASVTLALAIPPLPGGLAALAGAILHGLLAAGLVIGLVSR